MLTLGVPVICTVFSAPDWLIAIVPVTVAFIEPELTVTACALSNCTLCAVANCTVAVPEMETVPLVMVTAGVPLIVTEGVPLISTLPAAMYVLIW